MTLPLEETLPRRAQFVVNANILGSSFEVKSKPHKAAQYSGICDNLRSLGDLTEFVSAQVGMLANQEANRSRTKSDHWNESIYLGILPFREEYQGLKTCY